MQPFDVLDPDLKVLGYRFLEASAGTGKTFAIENLYVRWVLEGIPLRQILVVTFTKAATRQLVERIHKRLQIAQKKTSNEEHLLLLEAALASYDEAKIYTIHGFCQSMLKRFYLESGCDLTFSNEQQLWEEWLVFLRGNLSADQVSAKQLEIFFGGKFEFQLRVLVRAWKPNIIDPLPDFCHVPSLIEKQFVQMEKIPFALVFEDLQKLQELYTDFTSYNEQYLIIANWCQTHRVTKKEVEKLLEGDGFFLSALKHAKRKKKEKPLSWLVPGLIPMLEQALLPLVEDLSDKKKIQDKLLAKFSFYRKTQPLQNATPDELLVAMKDALQKKVFLEAVQGQFQATVIDEFQDTDEIQWQIFHQLFIHSRVLKAFCLVGDPKQSIYAFRDADLYTYLAAKKAFFPEELAALSINYRSQKPLVHALNALFGGQNRPAWMHLPKLGQTLDVALVQAFDQSLETPTAKSSVQVVIARELDDLFHYIAEQIEFWKKRDVVPKEIAILVKDRYEARKLIKYLQDSGIKTHYSSQGHLADTATFDAVIDLVALLERPRDSKRLKKVVAGPLIAWPAELLSKGLFDASFPRMMSSVQKLTVIFEEKGLAACLRAFFEEPLFDQVSIAENLLRNDDFGGYEEFQQITEMLIEECDQKGIGLLQIRLLLMKIKQERRFEEEEYEKRSSVDDDAVEITTIFKSKGLEYEVVFPLALATGRVKPEEDEEKIAEKMRLLYVALTRAKQCVYFPWLIDIKSKQLSTTELFFQSWMGSLDPEKIMYELKEVSKTCALSVEEIKGKITVQNRDSMSALLEIPAPLPFCRRFEPRLMTSFSSMTKGEMMTGQIFVPRKEVTPLSEVLPLGAETGKFIHAILEEIFHASLHHPYQKERILKLIEKKVQATSFETVKDEISQLIDGVFAVPIHSRESVFTLKEIAPSMLMPEMEFVYEEKGNLCKGFIDLVFFHDGFYYVADWKTNWLPDYSLEQLAASIQEKHYDIQAKIYAEALKRYVKLFDRRPFEECFGGAYYLYLRGMQWIKVLT